MNSTFIAQILISLQKRLNINLNVWDIDMTRDKNGYTFINEEAYGRSGCDKRNISY